MSRLPDFVNGKLPIGIHQCSGDEFIDRFCSGEERKGFAKSVSDILDFAKDRNARYLFFGGSFVTDSKLPGDIDCLMAFVLDEFIPSRTERITLGSIRLDIQFCSLEHRAILDSFVYLFSRNRYGAEVGVVQVDLYANSEVWEIKHQPDDHAIEIVKRAYVNRRLIDLNEPTGILVTIHGLLSDGPWNNEIAPIASSQGWIFAPYTYETNKPDLLFKSGKRAAVVDQFREWIYELSQRYDAPISILAHSFGTYIITSYIQGFANPPVGFDSVILTGSIITSSFDWNPYIGKSVARILNMRSPGDEWVKQMPQTELKKYIGMDTLFGDSGQAGFQTPCTSLFEIENSIFNHNNTIKRDIVETMWMPFLNGNKNALDTEQHIKMRRR
ncbi:DUF6932 family protein [Hymenobacter convexus]|uniref:DUF6932 family protein n=1 Tax=Hymenobacter sp. CA1UV-4 TaxID=3063782 RepID=UPI002712F805|nr:hypothetical protein [Hymenobacter sp. CA1UV-4]MDO7851596.1 hypothetical protein [Hymenobacter sp. CA1UV-4]